jgi:hypothetical protein
MTSKVRPNVLFQTSSAPDHVAASPEIVVPLAVAELMDMLELAVDTGSTAKSTLPFLAPGWPCPIATKDAVTHVFSICLDLARAKSVGV